MHRHLRITVVVSSMTLLGCLADSSGPPDTGSARLAFVPVFQSASAGIVDLDKVHATLRRLGADSVFADTLVQIPPEADSLVLEWPILLLTADRTFLLRLAFITAAGDTAFIGGPVQVTAETDPNVPVVPTDVGVTYVGVGANAASVRITNPGAIVLFGASVTLTAEALDAQGQAIAGTPIAWSSLDPALATVPDPAVGTVVAGTQAGPARIVATLLTGPADTLAVSVVSTDLRLLFHASGISTFSDPDSLDSGRWFEIVDPVAMVVFPPLAVSRGDEEIVGLAYDPVTNRVFATDRDCDLFNVDPATGVETLVGNTSGDTTSRCSGQDPWYLKGLAFEPGTGRLLGGVTPEFSDGRIYEVNPVTAGVSMIGQVFTTAGDSLDGYNGFAFHPATGVLHVLGHLAGDALRTRYLMTVDVATLTATAVALLPERGVADITFTSDGTLYAVTGDGADTPESLWTVALTTAAMTLVMGLGNGDDGEAIVAVPVQGAAAPPSAPTTSSR